MIKSQRGEIVTIIAIGALIVLGITSLITSKFLGQNKQTTKTFAQVSCEGWKCPGNQCGNCGVNGWWAQGCWDFCASNGCKQSQGACSPCGNINLYCKNADQGNCIPGQSGYRCGNDSCGHIDTSGACGSPPGGGGGTCTTKTCNGGNGNQYDTDGTNNYSSINTSCDASKKIADLNSYCGITGGGGGCTPGNCSGTSDPWYCGKECADSCVRQLFGDPNKWRQEKANNCGFKDINLCSTHDCSSGGTGQAYCRATDGTHYQQGTNYCDGNKLMFCQNNNGTGNSQLVKDCGGSGCNPVNQQCNGTSQPPGATCPSATYCKSSCQGSPTDDSGNNNYTCSQTGQKCCNPLQPAGGSCSDVQSCPNDTTIKYRTSGSNYYAPTDSCTSPIDNPCGTGVGPSTCTTNCGSIRGSVVLAGSYTNQTYDSIKIYQDISQNGTFTNYATTANDNKNWAWNNVSKDSTNYYFKARMYDKNGTQIGTDSPATGSYQYGALGVVITLNDTTQATSFQYQGYITNTETQNPGSLSDLSIYLIIGNTSLVSSAIPLAPESVIPSRGDFTITLQVPDNQPLPQDYSCSLMIKDNKGNQVGSVINLDKCNPSVTPIYLNEAGQIDYKKPVSGGGAIEGGKVINAAITANLIGSCQNYQSFDNNSGITIDNPDLQISPETFNLSPSNPTNQTFTISKKDQQKLDTDLAKAGTFVLTIDAYFTNGLLKTQFEKTDTFDYKVLSNSTNRTYTLEATDPSCKSTNISIDDFYLRQAKQADISVPTGTKVTWTNTLNYDLFLYIYYGDSKSGDLQDSEIISPKGHKDLQGILTDFRFFTYNHPGTYAYEVCDVSWTGRTCDNSRDTWGNIIVK